MVVDAGYPTDGYPADESRTARGSDYARLSREIREAGLLRRRHGYYIAKITVNLLLLLGGWTAFFLLGPSWWQLLVAAFLGVMFGQCGFIGHDAGHRQISGSKRTDDLIGRVHGNLLIGLSFGWWISKHNRHHAHPNQVGRDPDIAGAAIAFTPDQALARRGMGAWLARHQAWLFFPMLLLEGLHLHVAGVRALLSRSRSAAKWLEGTLLIAHIAGYLAAVFLVLPVLQAVIFIVIQQSVFGVYLGCAFAPNHKGMPVIRGRREDRLPPSSGHHLTQHPGRMVHRLRPRRAQLPDRTSPVSFHAAAQLAACAGTDTSVLRGERHRLQSDRTPGLLRAGAPPPRYRRRDARGRPVLAGTYASDLAGLHRDGRDHLGRLHVRHQIRDDLPERRVGNAGARVLERLPERRVPVSLALHHQDLRVRPGYEVNEREDRILGGASLFISRENSARLT